MNDQSVSTPTITPPTNPGLVLMVCLASLLLIGFIIFVIVGIIRATEQENNNNNTATEPCINTVDTADLIKIPDTGANCVQGGVTGSLYYVGKLGDGKFDYVVAPWATSPLNVCVGFCESYTSGTCLGPNYDGKTAQENFDDCLKQLSPSTCQPPLPIAIKDAILYYAYSPTCHICDNCGQQ